MRTADFDFPLPEELIAQTPLSRREASRLLVLDRSAGKIAHQKFADLLDYFDPGDVLVLNDSRVIPARLRGNNARTGGEFEILLLEEKNQNDWWCLLRPGKRARVGTQIILRPREGTVPQHHYAELHATVAEINDEGHRRLRFEGVADIKDQLDSFGEVPLPPYIRRASSNELESDRERYQTVFAKARGSVAAPTAGLHFSQAFLEKARALGVRVCFVTLHVGLGTFAPVKTEVLSGHKMHEEGFDVPQDTAREINSAKTDGRRIIAVGTTTLRVLESLAIASTNKPLPDSTIQRLPDSMIRSGPGRTNIFIYPPFDFRVVDMLLTNFHLPRSTLLMLVSAFAAPKNTSGRELILSAYSAAIAERYRFFSYGDAMLIL